MKTSIKTQMLVLTMSSLMTGASLASGIKTINNEYYQPQITQQLLEDQSDDLKAVPPLPKIIVQINEEGALYVGKRRDNYYFWVLKDRINQVILEEIVPIEPGSQQVLEVQLSRKTSAIFYADYLVNNNAIPLVFKGELDDGKIAMPVDPDSFIRMARYVNKQGQRMTVDDRNPGLIDIIRRQNEIFAAVDAAEISLQTDVENFKNITSSSIVTFKQQMEDAESYGQQELNDYESLTLNYQQQFLGQLDRDIVQLQQSNTELISNINQQVNHYTNNVVPCVDDIDKQMGGDVEKVVSLLDVEDSTEDLNEKSEMMIEQTELKMDSQSLKMEECSTSLATLENYDSNNIISENPYMKLNVGTELLEQRVTETMELWSTDLLTDSEDLAAQIGIDQMVESTQAYDNVFDQWMSTEYLLMKYQQKPVKKSLLIDDSHEIRGGQEILCGDETFNIAFDIIGISVILGTPFNDRIITGNRNNLILSFSGNDCIESHAGHDLILSGTGQDVVYAGDDHDIVHGGQGDDEIHGSAGKDYTIYIGGVPLKFNIGNLLMGGAGDDRIFGGEVNADRGENGSVENYGFTDIILGDAFLFGGENGNDIILGEMGIDFLFGQAGNDTLSNITPGAITVAGVPVRLGSFFFGGIGDDNITGSNTPTIGDFAFGGNNNDTINLGGGIDFGFGGSGDDTINGQDGTDFIFGNVGDDNITGGDGFDLVSGDRGNDLVRGSQGPFDLILGGRGQDRLFGDDGIDLIFGSQDEDNINGNGGYDLIFGGAADDIIHGDDDIDIIFGNIGVDTLYGDNGMDLIFGNGGSDTLFGGNDTDVMFGNSNTTVDSVETLWGGNGIDNMFGNSGNDIMYGEADIDLMFGNSDTDQMFGGSGQDLMFGNSGDDVIDGESDIDVLFGNEGNDIISGGLGQDLGFGNAGCDIINGGDQTDILFGNSNNDQLNGGNGLDVLFGNSGSDQLWGNSGADVLFGNEGDDYISGDNNADVIFGNSGNDYIIGGSSGDVIFGNSGNDYVNGNTGNDVIFGNSGDDILDGNNDNDKIFGNEGNDRINSGNGRDVVFGNRGNDRMRVVEGTNFAFGNRGNDTMDGYWPFGGDSRDRMWGNRDNDNLTGNRRNQRDRRYGGFGSDSKSWDRTFVNFAEFNVNWVNPGCDD